MHGKSPISVPTPRTATSVKRVIHTKEHDLGGFAVRRALPVTGQRMVGPWIFFDHMGPAHFPPGQGIDVRPRPHINLATVSYLFEGEMLHRDSLGNEIAIKPGAHAWSSSAGSVFPPATSGGTSSPAVRTGSNRRNATGPREASPKSRATRRNSFPFRSAKRHAHPARKPAITMKRPAVINRGPFVDDHRTRSIPTWRTPASKFLRFRTPPPAGTDRPTDTSRTSPAR